EEKIRDYLLKPQAVDDKSGYFMQAGYTREEYWELLRDIKEQLLPSEGEYQKTNRFGDYYIVTGYLEGPNGRRLGVRSIWLHDRNNRIRLATLFPD
ncbi:MAG: DUF6883 domain-containing protein, partial [Candidatus Kapaibacterium sp.]